MLVPRGFLLCAIQVARRTQRASMRGRLVSLDRARSRFTKWDGTTGTMGVHVAAVVSRFSWCRPA